MLAKKLLLDIRMFVIKNHNFPATCLSNSDKNKVENKKPLPIIYEKTLDGGVEQTTFVKDFYEAGYNAFTFSTIFNKLKEKYRLTNADISKATNIQTSTLSNLQSRQDIYQPLKSTVLVISLGLALDVDDAKILMASAGYCFGTHRDLIVEYFLSKKSDFVEYVNTHFSRSDEYEKSIAVAKNICNAVNEAIDNFHLDPLFSDNANLSR